jgi:hypothetical protein
MMDDGVMSLDRGRRHLPAKQGRGTRRVMLILFPRHSAFRGAKGEVPSSYEGDGVMSHDRGFRLPSACEGAESA